LSELNVEDYLAAQKHERDGGVFRFFRAKETVKTGDMSHVLIGPEAVDALEKWLEVRGREPGPLFISLKGGRLGPKAIAEVFRKFKTRRMNHDFSKISAHSFRKFRTNNSSIKDKWNRWLMGKAVDTYHEEPPVEKIIKEYMEKYQEELAVFEVSVSMQRVQELEEKYEYLVNHYTEVLNQKKRRAKFEDKMEVSAKGAPTGVVSDVVYDVKSIAKNISKKDMLELMTAFQNRLEEAEE